MNESENLILEILRKIQADQADLKKDNREIKNLCRVLNGRCIPYEAMFRICGAISCVKGKRWRIWTSGSNASRRDWN